MKNTRTKKLVTSAILIAMGTAISLFCEFIPFLNLPFGGTITVASLLPLVIIGYMYGPAWGFGSAFVYSLLQILVGFKTVGALFTPTSDSYMGIAVAFGVILLDYILAFTSVGISSFFRNMKKPVAAIVVGSIVGLAVCYAFHVLSGALFYGVWAEWFFTDTLFKDFSVSRWIMDNFSGAGLSTVYSVIYNGCYMIPEIVITAVVGAVVAVFPVIEKNKEI
ncbi:MAG: energy-coupled thiamine transporter ThiT [Clostridia bacterium]|nr:energy-coupled thiamine transporter ThiT [Clostridia bacterium]